MAKSEHRSRGILVVMIGVVLAVGCGMALTGGTLTPTKSVVFTVVVAAVTAAFFRKIGVVIGAVVTSLVLCFLVAPLVPGLTG